MKKCPFCAEEIQDEAIVCRYCGRDIPIVPKRRMTEAEKSVLEKWGMIEPKPSISQQPNAKKPVKVWSAVLLNCIPIMGLGYIYIKKPGRFAVVFTLQLFTLAPMTWLGLRQYNEYLLILIWIISIFDVYAQAKAINKAYRPSGNP